MQYNVFKLVLSILLYDACCISNCWEMFSLLTSSIVCSSPYNLKELQMFQVLTLTLVISFLQLLLAERVCYPLLSWLVFECGTFTMKDNPSKKQSGLFEQDLFFWIPLHCIMNLKCVRIWRRDSHHNSHQKYPSTSLHSCLYANQHVCTLNIHFE